MTYTRSARRVSGVPLPVFGIPLLFASMVAMADASWPTNPQTRAECEDPAAQMLAMEERASALRRQKYKEAEAAEYATGGAKYRALMDLIDEQGKEAGRLRDQRYALEKACRTAATENEKVAKEKQDEAKSMLDRVRELKEGYEEAKKAYEIAKDIYLKPPAELAEDAMNRATGRMADDAVASAYKRRNDAYSASLEAAMNDAKRKTVDLVRRSEIVASIQDASFVQVKSQIHQVWGDVNDLEASIRSRDNSPSPAPSSPTVADSPPAEPAGNPVASFFRNAVKGVSDKVKEVTGAIQASVDKPVPAAADPSPAVAAPTPAVAARPLTPGEQCFATESSCQKGCVAIAAVGGFLAIFGGGGSATAGATGEQVQLCTNRCTEAKSGCDQEVAAAEQARVQPVNAPVVGGSTNATGAGVGSGQGCTAEIAQAVNAQAERKNVAGRGRITRTEFEGTVKGVLSLGCDSKFPTIVKDAEQQIARNVSNIEKTRTLYRDNPDLLAYSVNENKAEAAGSGVALCAARARATQCESSTPAMAPAPAASPAGGRTGLPFAECQRQENASDVGRKLTALPDSNTNLKTRGIIVASDFMIKTYSQCLPDQRAQQMVAQYRTTREQTLRTCRQVSSSDNCLVSPF